ncbi:MAG: lysozyme inhibitor LprI family protein [Flavobacterium sp.]
MDKLESLKKIKIFLDEGLISEEEFQKLKSDITQVKELNSDTIEKRAVSTIKTIPNLHSNKKECPNCKILLPIYTKKCSTCNYNFISDSSLEINNTFKEVQQFIDLNESQKNIADNQKSNKSYYIFFGTIIILIFVGWYYNDFKNKNISNQNEIDRIQQDSILAVKSEDSIADGLNKYKTKVYQDSIKMATQEDTSSINNINLGENDMGSNIKSADELEVADKKLNTLYKQVMSVLDESEKTTLRNEQRKWIKYRDISCEEETKDMNGSLYNAFLNNCLTEKTEKRIEELNEILESKE